MACAEQPLKKRRLYESFSDPQPPPSPPAQQESLSQPATSVAAPLTPPPPSQEEILGRSRNRDEIRSVHECYKRLKLCIDQKDGRRSPVLEQAYRSLISASRGCTSVKRIVADLIPRYAPYCPTAIEDATQVVIDMHNCSLEAIRNGEDTDSVVFQTAKACIFGLFDLCSAASSKKPKSSVARGVCSAVFQNVFTFFVSSFEGKDIFQIVDKNVLKMQDSDEIFSQLVQKASDGDGSPLIRLSQFRGLSLLKIFFYFPRNSIATCFEFFNSASTDKVDKGRYLITHLTNKINDIDAASSKPESDENSVQTSSKDREITGQGPDSMSGIGEASPILKSCLLGMVLVKNLSIGRWALSKFKRLCSLSSFKDVSSAIPSLEEIFELLGKGIKLEDYQMESDEDDSGRFSGLHVRPHSSAENDVRSSAGSVYDSGGSRSMDLETVDQRDLSCGRSSVPRSLTNHQTPSPAARMPSDVRSNSSEGRNNFVHAASPSHRAASPSHRVASCGPSSSQIVWYFDGDPNAVDIFSASGQLWLGCLGPDESEGHLRFQLDRFGPVDRFFFCPVKGFALVEYRSIIDAIRAREYLRMQFPWRIKFMDIGVGTRGTLNGITYGYSTHVYVGRISSQWERDEIVYESRKALYKGPRMVTDLYYEGALLMEFDTPDEAATVMAHLRYYRREKVNIHLTAANLPVPHEDGGSHSERHHQISFSSKQDSGSGELVSPRMDMENHRTPVPSGVSFQQSWPGSNITLVNPAQGGNPPCVPMSTPGPPVTPGPQIPPSPFVQQPVYPPPNTSWDTRPLGHHLPVNPISPSGNAVAPLSQIQGPPVQHVGGNAVAAPFLPPPVNPVPQMQGPPVQHFDQMYPPPVPPPLSSIPPPPSEMLPPPPHVPAPPLPQSHPPSVPPPPSSPPPPPPPPPSPPLVMETTELEASNQNVGHHWQGALSKSGVHYCTIYARRLESEICKYFNAASEPVEWPVKLDMTKRTDLQHVKSTFTSTPPQRMEVCQLVPLSSGDHKGFQDFISYLKQRECAGVIKIPATSSVWARLLFILPCSEEICSLLSVSPCSSECLIGLVLPKETNLEGT